MKLGARGRDLIKAREAFRLTAYRPTPEDVWTIGWGHTEGVTAGMEITAAQADSFFEGDVAGAVAAVNATGAALTQGQFDALVSLVFNVGVEAVAPRSTIGRALRMGDRFAAWRGFALWTKQGGHDLRGLAARRAEEMALFMADPF